MPRLIVDAMGGDHGPRVVLEGVVQALPELLNEPGELILLGDEPQMRHLLGKRRYHSLLKALDPHSTSPFRVRIIHSSEAIQMEDSIRAIRSKPNATINLGCQLAGQSYSEIKKTLTSEEGSSASEDHLRCPAVFISAGHSGAILTSALLHLGRLPQVERPAIAVKLPTLNPDGCIFIDVGANVDCKPEHLRDFAVMGAIYAQVERKSPTLPQVALLSNGQEKQKGNELTRASAELIEKLSCFQSNPRAIGQFIGYKEGKEIFQGQVDVVVTDGFVGNVVLKSLEGLGLAVIATLKQEAKRSLLTSLGFLLSAGVFARFKRKLDYAEYGAAPLLGVAGYIFICHGRSNPKAIKNAILRARSAAQRRFVERLEKALINA
jgi:glycerol-3-phosphate acyltransferase PlsX